MSSVVNIVLSHQPPSELFPVLAQWQTCVPSDSIQFVSLAGGAIAASVAVAALMISQPAGDSGRIGTPAQQQNASIASVVGTLPANKKPSAPATVPPWLSGNSASLLSQQASATLGEPFDNRRQQGYSQRLSTDPAMRGYRTLDNNDGSYLLLLDRGQSATAEGPRQAGAIAQ